MLHSLTLDVRKSVGFILGAGKEDANPPRERSLLGTGFFIDHYINKARRTLLISARHLLNRRSNVGRDDQARFLWINDKNGRRMEIRLPDRDDWAQHPTTDVAAVECTPPRDWDGYCHSSSSLLERVKANALPIGEGTETFFAGLFSGYSGGDGIEPICRFGHIALMPRREMTLKFYPGNENNVYA